MTLTAGVLLVLAPLLIFITTRTAKSTAEKRKELWDRYRSCGFRRRRAAAHFLRGVKPVEPWQLQAARDTGLNPAERLRACDARAVCWKAWRSRRAFQCCEFTFRSLIGSQSRAGEAAAHGPFVLAANHCSHLDALILDRRSGRVIGNALSRSLLATSSFKRLQSVCSPQSCSTLCRYGGKTVVRMLLQSCGANCRKKKRFSSSSRKADARAPVQ